MELTASYLTLAGSRFGEPVKNDIIMRSRAAAHAGYSSIGASAQEVIASGDSLYAIRQAIRDCPVREIEWVDLARVDKGVWHTTFAMANILGATRVNAGVCSDGELNLMEIALNLKRYAREARRHNLTVCVEPVVFGSLWEPTKIVDLLNMVREVNVGLLFDIWQMDHADYRDPRSVDIPAWRINSLQIAETANGMLGQGLFADSQDNRKLPGQGVSESAVQIKKLMAEGFTGPMSVEVANTELREMSAYEAARVSYDATVKVLRSCGLN